MADSLLSRPTLVGIMQEAPQYQALSLGSTDTVLLVGHADAEVMHEPYRVVNIKKAVTFLGTDSTSPLLRGLLEAYNSGCKDIWLYAAAPMSEYVAPNQDRFTATFTSGVITGLSPDVPQNTAAYVNISTGFYSASDQGMYNYYQKWYERLFHAYARLLTWDFPDYIVPIEAAFYNTGTVDFAKQLINYCVDAFTQTGSIILGVLGTRIANPTTADVTALATDSRMASYGENGKFVMVVVGEGLIAHPQISTTYSSSFAVQTACLLAVASLNRSISGLKLPGVSTIIGNNLSDDQIQSLCLAKLNPVVRTQKGKRGLAYEARLLTDNTLGATGSDYWSMTQMRIVAQVVNKIRQIGYNYIGELTFDLFREAVNSYLKSLKNNNFVVDYTLKIEASPVTGTATVTVGLTPISGIRNIYFTTTVGPGR